MKDHTASCLILREGVCTCLGRGLPPWIAHCIETDCKCGCHTDNNHG